MVKLLQEPKRARQVGDQARKTIPQVLNRTAANYYEELFSHLIDPKALKARASGDEVATRMCKLPSYPTFSTKRLVFNSPWQPPLKLTLANDLVIPDERQSHIVDRCY